VTELLYPAGEPPVPGSAVEVAPDVLWLRMPMPFALSYINFWAIRDGDAWAIVDSGLHTVETATAWLQLVAPGGPLQGRRVSRVFATHMHPDHVGMAGWLTRCFGCQLWMSRLEYLHCRMLVADTGREAPADGVRFFLSARRLAGRADRNVPRALRRLRPDDPCATRQLPAAGGRRSAAHRRK